MQHHTHLWKKHSLAIPLKLSCLCTDELRTGTSLKYRPNDLLSVCRHYRPLWTWQFSRWTQTDSYLHTWCTCSSNVQYGWISKCNRLIAWCKMHEKKISKKYISWWKCFWHDFKVFCIVLSVHGDYCKNLCIKEISKVKESNSGSLMWFVSKTFPKGSSY